jgi:glycosyltransferase involved in cell wall biosynthesis
VRVVFLNETLPEGMGYAGLAIPKTMKKMGVDVHYVTAGLPVYHSMANYELTYGKFHKKADPAGTIREIEGYSVHFLDHKKTYGGVRMLGLSEKLRELRPDVVQTFSHVAWAPLDAALLQRSHGYRLFTGNHTTASVYPLANMDVGLLHPKRIKEFLIRGLPGRFVSSRMERCYGATVDCSRVAQHFFGVDPEKLKTVPLGVETDIFHPAQTDEERRDAIELRRGLGVGDDEILCAYTGRFSEEKSPLLLARAVGELRESGKPYRAVFFGEGVQREQIEEVEGTIVRPFVHYSALGALYRAADIGVWPTQESTSMIDCAASGTPIVVNDTIAAVERVEGNGLRYRLGGIADLKRALLELLDHDLREKLGRAGAEKMERNYSWRALVQIRLDDYRAALLAE